MQRYRYIHTYRKVRKNDSLQWRNYMFDAIDETVRSVSGTVGFMQYLTNGSALPVQNVFFFVLALVSLLGLIDSMAQKSKKLAAFSRSSTPVLGIAGIVLAIYAIVTLIMSFTLYSKAFAVFLSFFCLSLTAIALSLVLAVRFVKTLFPSNHSVQNKADTIQNLGNGYLTTLCWINLSAGFFLLLAVGGITAAVR